MGIEAVRQDERILAADLVVRVQLGEGAFEAAQIHDISGGGVYLRTGLTSTLHAPVRVRFSRGERDELELQGEIVYVIGPDQVDAPKPVGVGIRFRNLAGDARKQYQSYLSKLMRYPRSGDDRPTVIIVDDDRDTREMLQVLLELEGYRVLHAANGLRLLSATRVDKPDAVLLDIRMSWMGGVEICQSLKANSQFRDIPVMFVSACTDAEERERAMRAGAEDYFTKPLDTDRLLARLRELTEKRRALRARQGSVIREIPA